ncbi:histidine phosphotransferase family protein [Salipiger mucosus]|uniref:Signal transduction histidine kinase n=1 Tax=Salipiger mucosus DSM 16094 TaxID=1123237 RepID=S9SBS7_9RHOB|nr:histidine phosphotransferase family protein [Salipiger mucosus]EPX83674.1 Signal transduction histidine kinase [Salipiger mucosus DSM 16094]
MSEDSAKLASLVGSRLCHDLVSPVGAIGNGLELIALSGAPGADEMALIEDSCASARARINFFRVAFGHASAEQMVGRNEAGKLLAELGAGGRLAADWSAPGDAPRREVQLAYLAYLCCESALPQGGTVRIERADPGAWRITGTGPRISVEPGIWAQLSTTSLVPEMTPARVHFACLARLASERGKILRAMPGEAAVTIELLPA